MPFNETIISGNNSKPRLVYSIQTSSCSLTKQALYVLKYILAVLSPFARQEFWLIQLHFLLKDKRIARQYGCSVRCSDYGYSQWAPHHSVISAISSEGVLASCVLKNPYERFNGHSFSQFLDEQLLPDMNPFNGENPRSVLVMGEHCIITWLNTDLCPKERLICIFRFIMTINRK